MFDYYSYTFPIVVNTVLTLGYVHHFPLHLFFLFVTSKKLAPFYFFTKVEDKL